MFKLIKEYNELLDMWYHYRKLCKRLSSIRYYRRRGKLKPERLSFFTHSFLTYNQKRLSNLHNKKDYSVFVENNELCLGKKPVFEARKKQLVGDLINIGISEEILKLGYEINFFDLDKTVENWIKENSYSFKNIKKTDFDRLSELQQEIIFNLIRIEDKVKTESYVHEYLNEIKNRDGNVVKEPEFPEDRITKF